MNGGVDSGSGCFAFRLQPALASSALFRNGSIPVFYTSMHPAIPNRIEDIIQAFLFANTSGGGAEFRAFMCRQTGEIHYQTEGLDSADFDDDLPDDIGDEAKYIPFPDKRELGLGKPLALDFAREFLPDDFDDVRDFFSRRGAYPKFEALLARRGAIERWHAFENEATERALREWCALHSIEIRD